MMEVIQRYVFEKELEPYEDDELEAQARSYDQHFTHARIPTDRLTEVYLEAMSTHGQYLLKVDDYLRAWERIRPTEYAGIETTDMARRGAKCTICGGRGMTVVWLPVERIEIEKECPYCRRVQKAVARV